MIGWRTIPVVVASLLLGAHFLRAEQPILVAVCVAAPLLLLVRRRAALWSLRIFLWVGAGVWAHTAFSIGARRVALGEPWTRMAIIIGAVCVFTAWAGAILGAADVRRRYD